MHPVVQRIYYDLTKIFLNTLRCEGGRHTFILDNDRSGCCPTRKTTVTYLPREHSVKPYTILSIYLRCNILDMS